MRPPAVPFPSCALESALDNPLLDGVYHRGGAAGDADLVVDVLQVMLDGFPGNDQGLGNLWVTLALGQQAQHLGLPLGQSAQLPTPGHGSLDARSTAQ